MISTGDGSPATRLEAPMRRKLLAAISQAAWPVMALGRPFEAMAADLRAQPTGQPVIETLSVLRSRLELQFAPGFSPTLQAAARTWVHTSADAVARYFGRFPVPKVELLLVPEDGSGVRGGVTYDEPSLLIRVRLGRQTTEAQFIDDWVLVHEMVHLAIPRVPRPQNWLHEGVATYVESVARGRVGLVPPATVWRVWAADMPQGQPQAGDAGLDHTPTWGRTYWGGAMFCLMADVEMLKRSAQRAATGAAACVARSAGCGGPLRGCLVGRSNPERSGCGGGADDPDRSVPAHEGFVRAGRPRQSLAQSRRGRRYAGRRCATREGPPRDPALVIRPRVRQRSSGSKPDSALG